MYNIFQYIHVASVYLYSRCRLVLVGCNIHRVLLYVRVKGGDNYFYYCLQMYCIMKNMYIRKLNIHRDSIHVGK